MPSGTNLFNLPPTQGGRGNVNLFPRSGDSGDLFADSFTTDSLPRVTSLDRFNDPSGSLPSPLEQTTTILQGEDEEYWYSDDDASMGESDDESSSRHPTRGFRANDFDILVSSGRHDDSDILGIRMRSFSPHYAPHSLTTYTPSSRDSPLNDERTAFIFRYFVNVTGPSLSLYERHPLDPSPVFHGEEVPKARRHIWTCTV